MTKNAKTLEMSWNMTILVPRAPRFSKDITSTDHEHMTKGNEGSGDETRVCLSGMRHGHTRPQSPTFLLVGGALARETFRVPSRWLGEMLGSVDKNGANLCHDVVH